MKKLLCVSVLLFFPAISHAQSRGAGMSGPGGSGPMGGGSSASGGVGGGGSSSATPAISRDHNAKGVTSYRNSGPFVLTEVVPWKQAVELGEPKQERDLAAVARETREEVAKEPPARVTLSN